MFKHKITSNAYMSPKAPTKMGIGSKEKWFSGQPRWYKGIKYLKPKNPII